MPFWNRNSKPHKKYSLLSLQEHRKRKNALIDSLNNPKQKTRSQRVLRFPLLSGKESLAGSLTAEAALVMPVFLFAMANLLSLFLVYHRYAQQLAQVHQSGRLLSMLSYEEGEQAGEQDIRLVRVDRAAPLFRIPGLQGFVVVSGCVMHKWIGYGLEGNAGEQQEGQEMVYVAESGAVYHRSRSCSYLNPSVRMVSRAQAQEMRNGAGEKYGPCESCGGMSETVYVTEDGNRYHATIGCGGLKRTVSCVPLGEAVEAGRRPCTRCGG